MQRLYLKLSFIALDEFKDIVISTKLIGGKAASSNKLRIHFYDESFLDVWLSKNGDYSYHWEHRAQRGLLHRWDNAPDHDELSTFPEHFHEGSDKNIKESKLSSDSEEAFKYVLRYIRDKIRTF